MRTLNQLAYLRFFANFGKDLNLFIKPYDSLELDAVMIIAN
jgi:hypothetical protein